MATDSLLLAEFFEEHYRPKRLTGCSESTVRQYRIHFRKLEAFLGRPALLSDLTDDVLSGFMGSILGRGRNPRTANKARDGISALWRYAFDRRLVVTKPDVSAIPEYKRVPIAWTAEEMQRQFDALNSDTVRRMPTISGAPAWLWWGTLLLTLYDTAARVGAVLGANRGDYQAELRRLLLRAEHQKQREDQAFILDPQTAGLLAELLQCSNSDRLFAWDKGYTYLWHRYGVILELAGLPHGRMDKFHRIRKTTATLADFHLGPGTATRLLGHSDGRVTKKYLDRTIFPEAEIASKLPRPSFCLPDGGFRPQRYAADKALSDVLTDYREHCRVRYGETRAVRRLDKLLADCGFKTVSDLRFDLLAANIAAQREDANHWMLRKLRSDSQQFVAWLSERIPLHAEPVTIPTLARIEPSPDEMLPVVTTARAEMRAALKRTVKVASTTQAYLRLLCADRSPAEISREFGVNPNTVRQTLTRLHNRLGLKTLTGLAIWAACNGLAVCELPNQKGGAA